VVFAFSWAAVDKLISIDQSHVRDRSSLSPIGDRAYLGAVARAASMLSSSYEIAVGANSNILRVRLLQEQLIDLRIRNDLLYA